MAGVEHGKDVARTSDKWWMALRCKILRGKGIITRQLAELVPSYIALSDLYSIALHLADLSMISSGDLLANCRTSLAQVMGGIVISLFCYFPDPQLLLPPNSVCNASHDLR